VEIVYVRLVLMLSSSFKACVEGASEQRREIRRAVPLVMAVGLLIFAVGVVLSVFVFTQTTSRNADPRPFPMMFVGLVIFVFGVFMYVWVRVIARADSFDVYIQPVSKEVRVNVLQCEYAEGSVGLLNMVFG
jgi:FtsH-binding integral membrane protein